MGEISWLAENRLVSQEGLCSMEYVSKLASKYVSKYIYKYGNRANFPEITHLTYIPNTLLSKYIFHKAGNILVSTFLKLRAFS
jgi:hypothetical protein